MAEFHDQVSGRKTERPELKKALEAGRKRKYDVLLFWSLDRLSRQGVLPTLLLLNQLSQYGVKYRSLQEAWIDSLGAFSDAVIGILATVAKRPSVFLAVSAAAWNEHVRRARFLAVLVSSWIAVESPDCGSRG